MKVNWKHMYSNQGYRAVYPNEYVVRFISKYFGPSNIPFKHKDNSSIKILDLGSGSGRHIIYLAREGFSVYGIEQTEEGVEQTKRWLESENLNAEVKTGDFSNTEYPDDFFDAIIDFQAIQHNNIEGIEKSFNEAHRILKEDGLFLSILRSKEDYLSEKGTKLEHNTYTDINQGDMTGAGICHFFEKQELKDLASKFKVLSLEVNKRSVNKGEDFICEWLLTLKKSQ